MSLYLSPYLSSSLVPASTLNASVLFFLSINFITLTVFYCLYVSHIVPPSLSLSLSLLLFISLYNCLFISIFVGSFVFSSLNQLYLSFFLLFPIVYLLTFSLFNCFLLSLSLSVYYSFALFPFFIHFVFLNLHSQPGFPA